ncbi:hypothetical protein J41TS12_11210 [Paenibacillus antibioticophila]|uniref:Uncharacterized protein n=1 Tax=Paenibacillus antibioticophila TaxID=1274374 RepID=A0A919XTR1_9BACL|nr:hypothetical protein [Paenibacillus antibioticophila]GIO36260.1 hypothetical protein J41TS12_11210 [Paenibacillus antibioticophila]
MQMYKGPKREYPLLGYIISYSLAACLIIYAVVSIFNRESPTKEESANIKNESTAVVQVEKDEPKSQFSNDIFSLEYPTDWTISKNDYGISITSPTIDSGYKDNIIIETLENSNSGKGHSAVELTDALVDSISSDDIPYMSNYKLITSKVVSHQGSESVEFTSEYTMQEMNIDVISYNLIVPTAKNVFLLSFSTSYEADANKKSAFFKKLVTSFKIYPAQFVTELVKDSARDSKLNNSVFPLSNELTVNNTSITLIGAEFGDDQAVGSGIKYDDIEDDVSETLARGFARGFKKGYSDEADKRDASFALYIKATPHDAKSPRDIERFTPDIEITDDKGDTGVLLYNSFSEKYLTIDEYTYGVIIFAVYSDSKEFNITFNDKKFKITDIPYMKFE